jgi:hypothetical protein
MGSVASLAVSSSPDEISTNTAGVTVSGLRRGGENAFSLDADGVALSVLVGGTLLGWRCAGTAAGGCGVIRREPISSAAVRGRLLARGDIGVAASGETWLVLLVVLAGGVVRAGTKGSSLVLLWASKLAPTVMSAAEYAPDGRSSDDIRALDWALETSSVSLPDAPSTWHVSGVSIIMPWRTATFCTSTCIGKEDKREQVVDGRDYA